MGSIISEHHLKRIETILARRVSSTVLAGGERLAGKSSLDGFDFSEGNFLPPTVITDVNIEDELWQEEVFGPVVVVKRFSVSVLFFIFMLALYDLSHPPGQDEREGVALANASKYGLGAGIWTSDLSRAHRVASEIQSGLVWVNTHHRNDPSSPWSVQSEGLFYLVLSLKF